MSITLCSGRPSSDGRVFVSLKGKGEKVFRSAVSRKKAEKLEAREATWEEKRASLSLAEMIAMSARHPVFGNIVFLGSSPKFFNFESLPKYGLGRRQNRLRHTAPPTQKMIVGQTALVSFTSTFSLDRAYVRAREMKVREFARR